MATIINTLEVVVEQPRPASRTPVPAPTPGQPAPLTPQDVEDVLERQARYAARVLAH